MKKISLYTMSILYVCAGINHFWNPNIYLKIMPSYLPCHLILVWLSGVFEIILVLLLLLPSTRALAAWGIMALLIAVFPANVQMAIDYWIAQNPNLYLALLRLPMQAVLLLWAFQFTKKQDASLNRTVC